MSLSTTIKWLINATASDVQTGTNQTFLFPAILCNGLKNPAMFEGGHCLYHAAIVEYDCSQ